MNRRLKGIFAADIAVPYWMLIPGILGIVFTNIIPSLQAVIMGFQENGTWVWFKNYSKVVASDAFWQSLTNTFFWAAGTLVLSTIIGLMAAILLNRALPGRTFFRTIFIIPWVTPPVVASMAWKYLYDQSLSPFNFILKATGIIQDNISFLGNPQWQVGPVTVPMLSVLIINIWATFPFMMVMILAALQNISDSLYEAAQIDGAGKIHQFFHVTLPSIVPVLGISLLLQGIWQFNSFNFMTIRINW